MEGVDVFRFEVRSILEKMKRKKKTTEPYGIVTEISA